MARVLDIAAVGGQGGRVAGGAPADGGADQNPDRRDKTRYGFGLCAGPARLQDASQADTGLFREAM